MYRPTRDRGAAPKSAKPRTLPCSVTEYRRCSTTVASSRASSWSTMAYVEGTDASEPLAEKYRKGTPPDDVVQIVTAVADVLDDADQRQLAAP